MRDQSPAVADRTTAVIPLLVCEHPDDVAEVRPESGFRLHARFFDGTQGLVDMSALVHSPNAGVFAALAVPGVFSQAAIELGAVTWPGGLPRARCDARGAS